MLTWCPAHADPTGASVGWFREYLESSELIGGTKVLLMVWLDVHGRV